MTACIGVLGYGVIGRRVADAVRLQPDMKVVGVSGRPDSFSLRDAELAGYDLYPTKQPTEKDVAARLSNVRGTLAELFDKIDVLLDCTPSGVPPELHSQLDKRTDLVTIVQGGEPHPERGVSFNAFANYHDACGQRFVRVISCSSTGTTRMLHAIDCSFGVQQAFVSLARRGSDPAKRSKAPFNALRPTLGPSHHARDVQTVLPHMNLFTVSVDCPTTLGHVLDFQIDLKEPVHTDDVLTLLHDWPRIVVGNVRSTADIAEHFQELGRPRDDRPEIFVWEPSLQLHGQTLYATLCVHMESITIPETIDCIRAIRGMCDNRWKSIWQTDRALGIAKAESCYDRSQQ